LEEFGGPKIVLVPVGSDQVPHIFLSRDVADKFQKEFGFIRPATIVHKFFKSLKGESKMSKRDPMSMITLNDPPEVIAKKIGGALTGGRKTVEEQRKMGGIPEDSVVYELYNYHFVEDDSKVQKVYDAYKSGRLLDGDMKKDITEIVIKFLEQHQSKRKKMMPIAEKLVMGL
jgi:tryptophanyl-tRNA synthetase